MWSKENEWGDIDTDDTKKSFKNNKMAFIVKLKDEKDPSIPTVYRRVKGNGVSGSLEI